MGLCESDSRTTGYKLWTEEEEGRNEIKTKQKIRSGCGWKRS